MGLAEHAEEYYYDLEGEDNKGREWYGDVGEHRAHWRYPQPTADKCMSDLLQDSGML